ncbi:MAG TPA: nuclear transport factor 2 family protein [Acidimicrobiales bacterium]|nr:nuclear transport factor 2 family protein [Acidimicrobiales bacterium]
MSEHPNVTLINDMTCAAVAGDKAALAKLFHDDLRFHVSGPLPKAGDHVGVEGFLDVIGTIFELTSGDVKLEQQFCIADDEWASEWEHAVLGRNGKTLDTYNSFVYRFDGGRIAEMWMACTAPASNVSFWN